MKAGDSASKASLSKKSRLHWHYFRNGEDHRSGADVSFADIVKIFGFRGVEVGKWVSKEEQQIAANLFFDALCDLMDILQVPESVISLKGSLALAFGSGGQKFACAHYNSAKRQLALAKNAGGGALAHEWFHAFDHYISSFMFETGNGLHIPNQFASELWLNEGAEFVEHPLNLSLSNAFSTMFLDDSGEHPSELVKASVAADKARGILYYARPQEVAARAFESLIQYQPTKNAFLVDGALDAEIARIDNPRKKLSDEALHGLYPNQHRLMLLQHHLFEYFAHLGQAISHQK